MSEERQFVLSLGCLDRVGVIARITSFVAELGGSIVEAGYHADTTTGWFFTRQAILASTVSLTVDELRAAFAPVAATFGPEVQWALHDSGTPRRTVVLASKESHCLRDLLGRQVTGELPSSIEAVISNHDHLGDLVLAHGVKFHHVPFPKSPEGKNYAFEQVSDLVDAYAPHAVVLAKFMQILPPQLCRRWAGRALNIHHSFLPSFIGARPYRQAYERGVKLIGATCHYVTEELDAGPILEQDVARIDHSDDERDLIRQGRDVERVVLARGLRWHLEGRVLIHAGKTVVFE